MHGTGHRKSAAGELLEFRNVMFRPKVAFFFSISRAFSYPCSYCSDTNHRVENFLVRIQFRVLEALFNAKLIVVISIE